MTEKVTHRIEHTAVQHVAVGSIKPNDYNPNRQSNYDFQLLLKSIEDDGFTQPILVNDGTSDPKLKDTIVDGEHRWAGMLVWHHCRETGLPIEGEHIHDLRNQRDDLLEQYETLEIPVVYTPMTIEQMKIATLRHNRARGSEDLELSAEVLREFQRVGEIGWAQDALLIGNRELESLLEDVDQLSDISSEKLKNEWKETEEGAKLGDAISTKSTEISGDNETIAVAATQKAVHWMRGREKDIREAITEEQRDLKKKDGSIYRLNLRYTGEEAFIVREILGDHPAERVLEICQEESDG